jgi:hypothetical protein
MDETGPDAPQPPTVARTCPECGQANPESARFCFCGYNLRAAPPPPAPVGVGGWLLFFCLQMLVLNPLVVGLQVLLELSAAAAAGVLSSPLGRVVLIDSAVRLALLAWGVTCGVALVTRRPSAVRMVRVFLPSFVIGYLLLVGLPFAAGLPESIRMHVAGTYMYRAGTLVLSGSFWFIYFGKSRLVKATYGEGERGPA